MSVEFNCLDDKFDAGDAVRFRLKLRHQTHSTTDAYSLRVNITLDHLNESLPLPVCTHSVQFDVASGNLVITMDLLSVDDEVSCNYSSVADNLIRPEQRITWYANLSYNSAVNDSGRIYQDFTNDTKTVASISQPSYFGLLNATSRGVALTINPGTSARLLNNEGWLVADGEALYVMAEFYFPEVTTSAEVSVNVSGNSVKVTPVKSETFVIYGSNIANNSAPLLRQPNEQSISLNSGDLQNIADGTVNGGDLVRFYLGFMVNAQVGTKFMLALSIDFNDGLAENSSTVLTVEVTVVMPSLGLGLASNGSLAESGDYAVVTCSLIHDSNSSGPAVGLSLSLYANLPFMEVEYGSTYYWFSNDPQYLTEESDYELTRSIDITLLATGNVTVQTIIALNDSCRSGQRIVVTCSGIYRDTGKFFDSKRYLL